MQRQWVCVLELEIARWCVFVWPVSLCVQPSSLEAASDCVSFSKRHGRKYTTVKCRCHLVCVWGGGILGYDAHTCLEAIVR